MRKLTDAQAEALFDLIQEQSLCPEEFFGDTVQQCPATAIGANDCPRCMRRAIARLRVANGEEDRYERMQ